jgi:short-subunit dehydrogenase
MELEGRGVLITGASRGIGCGLAEAFAAAGARVALAARSEGKVRELAERLGGTAHPVDLADPLAVRGFVARVEETAGPVDVLVNNAGLSHIDHFLEHDARTIDEIFHVNLLAPVQLCREIVPRMLERGRGHVVNVSSLAAVMTPPGLVHYGASKAGLGHYTAGLRFELRGLPIATTLVELGSVATELDDQTRAYGPMRRFLERQGGSAGKGEDRLTVETVADAVVKAVMSERPHVRLPRSLAPLAMLAEAPRRISALVFRSVDSGGRGLGRGRV